MNLTRRRFLQLSSMVLLMAGQTAPDAAHATTVPDDLGEWGTLGFPWTAHTAGPPSFEIHVLSRLAFGHTLADLDAIRDHHFSVGQWFEEQLYPTATDDDALTSRLAGFETLDKDITTLLQEYAQNNNGDPNIKTVYSHVIPELRRATILRKIYSKWQLKEVMVDFWTDHFNIFHEDSIQGWGKTVDDRDVIRTHALGNFHQMLLASAKSPPMITYLDNDSNSKRG